MMHTKRNNVFEDIKREIIESENESLEYYKEYLLKWKNFMTSKLKSTYIELDEMTYERDEYKECLESLLTVYLHFILYYRYNVF